MNDGVTSISPFGSRYFKDVSGTVRALIKKRQAQLEAGNFSPCHGPIADQKGKVRVPAGKALRPTEFQSIAYLVKGVLGRG